MRLSEHDRLAICQVTREVAGIGARVYLFGSRTRDDLRGGDIDLLVELPEDVVDRHALGFRLHAIHIHMYLRNIHGVAREHTHQFLRLPRLRQHRIEVPVELAVTNACAVFDLHCESAKLA